MTTKTGKAKGRRFQQEVRDLLLFFYPHGQFTSNLMGQPGTDIGDPLKVLPWTYLECRNWENWPSLNSVIEEMKKAKSPAWTYVLKRNRQDPLWIVPQHVMYDLLKHYFRSIEHEKQSDTWNHRTDPGPDRGRDSTIYTSARRPESVKVRMAVDARHRRSGR